MLLGKTWSKVSSSPRQLGRQFLEFQLNFPRALGHFFAKNGALLGPILGPQKGTQNWALPGSLNKIPIELEKWGPKMGTISEPLFGTFFGQFFVFFLCLFVHFFGLLGLLPQGYILPAVGQGGWILGSSSTLGPQEDSGCQYG